MSASVDSSAVEGSFVAAMREAGLLVSTPLQSDRLVRVDVDGHRKGNRAGWYRYYSDGLPAGAFGDWHDGKAHTWCARAVSELSPDERNAYRARMAEADRARKIEKAEKEQAAAARTATEWAAASEDCSRAPYLRDKRVGAYGVRAAGDAVLVPVRDIDGKLWSRQAIHQGGKKRFAEDGRVTGCFHVIGSLEGAKQAALAEGYSTGATIHEETRLPVIVAFFAGNLLPVGKAIRSKHPNLRLVVCADDDWRRPGNPGVSKATETTKAVDGILWVPEFGKDRGESDTDANDLARLHGPGKVKAQIEKAIAATIPPLISDAAITEWSKPLPPALPTPFANLNNLLGDGWRGLNYLVAPTGVGKTGLALLFGRHVAPAVPVVYVSTELGCRQAIARMAAQILKRPWLPLFKGEAITGKVIAEATKGLNFRCVEFADVGQVFGVANAIADAEGMAPMVILDYLQGAARDPGIDRRLAVSGVSNAALQWCRASGGVTLMVSSTARVSYAADDKRGRDLVSTAKESGDCEYDASAVLYVKVDPCPLNGTIDGEITVAKSRFGTIGDVGIIFEGASGSFRLGVQNLPTIERKVLGAIRGGLHSLNKIQDKVGGNRGKLSEALASLKERGIVDDANHIADEAYQKPRQNGSNDAQPARTTSGTSSLGGSGSGTTESGLGENHRESLTLSVIEGGSKTGSGSGTAKPKRGSGSAPYRGGNHPTAEEQDEDLT